MVLRWKGRGSQLDKLKLNKLEAETLQRLQDLSIDRLILHGGEAL